MERDTYIEYLVQFANRGRRPPMSYYTDRGNVPPDSYVKEYRAWLMQNPDKAKAMQKHQDRGDERGR